MKARRIVVTAGSTTAERRKLEDAARALRKAVHERLDAEIARLRAERADWLAQAERLESMAVEL